MTLWGQSRELQEGFIIAPIYFRFAQTFFSQAHRHSFADIPALKRACGRCLSKSDRARLQPSRRGHGDFDGAQSKAKHRIQIARTAKAFVVCEDVLCDCISECASEFTDRIAAPRVMMPRTHHSVGSTEKR
jgi:hypothetical protein